MFEAHPEAIHNMSLYDMEDYPQIINIILNYVCCNSNQSLSFMSVLCGRLKKQSSLARKKMKMSSLHQAVIVA